MRVTKEKAAENRERILTEAARLFRERGVSAVGMDALAEAAGMTHGSLYSQFDSKVRIPTKPARHSNMKPATRSEMKPATVPI